MSRRPVRSRGRVASTLTGSDSVTRTARVPSSRAMSIAILRFWRTRRRAEHGEPLPVKRQPRPVTSDPFQAGIDRAYQIVLRLVDPDTVRFGLQPRPDDVQVGILYGHAGQDRIVGAGRVRLTLLKRAGSGWPRRSGWPATAPGGRRSPRGHVHWVHGEITFDLREVRVGDAHRDRHSSTEMP